MSNSKGSIWSLALFGCTLLVLATLARHAKAEEVHEEDNGKAIADKRSGELESHKMRRSIELSAGKLERLFRRASGDGDGPDVDEKPHKGKKRKKNATTTTTSTTTKAPAPSSTTDKPTTKAPPSGDKLPTTTTTTKPGITAAPLTTTTTTTTTTAKPSLTPRKQDSADMLKTQEDEANIITNLENSLTSWDKWLSDNRLTLNRHFALEVYHHMRRIMLMQGLEHQKHQRPIMISGPPTSFIQDGSQVLPVTVRGAYPSERVRSRNRIF